MTPALLIALATIQQVSPEEAIAAQRTELRAQIRIDCPPGGEDEDIVVCGRGRGPAATAIESPMCPRTAGSSGFRARRRAAATRSPPTAASDCATWA